MVSSQPRTQVTSDHLELLKNELIRHPDKYGDEMASFLEDETGHIYSSKVLCKALDHAGWPKKAIQFHAKQQNTTERYQFRCLMNSWQVIFFLTAHSLTIKTFTSYYCVCYFYFKTELFFTPEKSIVCVDESNKKEKDARRKSGRALLPARPIIKVEAALGHEGAVSSVVAISDKGFMSATMVEIGEDGNVNADVFLKALEDDILPNMNCYNAIDPPEKCVLLLDNARVNDKLRIEFLCHQHRLPVLYLPPYSYDFNPIELLYNTARTKFQRDYRRNGMPLKKFSG